MSSNENKQQDAPEPAPAPIREVTLAPKDARKFFDMSVSAVEHMRFTEKSLCEASSAEQAKKIAEVIRSMFDQMADPSMLDLSACIGCNSVEFSRRFTTTAVEFDDITYAMLENNAQLFSLATGLPAVTTIHGNCIDVLTDTAQVDCVFIDAPWGGAAYREGQPVVLAYKYQDGEIPISHVVRQLVDKTDVVVVKVPRNMNRKFFAEIRGAFPYKRTIYVNPPKNKHGKQREIYQLIVLSTTEVPCPATITAARVGYRVMTTMPV